MKSVSKWLIANKVTLDIQKSKINTKKYKKNHNKSSDHFISKNFKVYGYCF